MNYIKHLNNFYDKIYYDRTIAPCQIALYLALFQYWNKERFQNPIYINRDEIMRLSKISSTTTYHRSMNILHDSGYIIYQPSFSPHRGSQIFFTDLSKVNKIEKLTTPKNDKVRKKRTKPATSSNNNELMTKLITKVEEPTSSENDKVMEKVMTKVTGPLYIDINNKHINNKLSLREERENFSKNENLFSKNNHPNPLRKIEQMPQKEKSSAKKEKGTIPTLEEVKAFFQEKNGSPLEAEKFFNYYEATGWLVGGKTKMNYAKSIKLMQYAVV